MNKIPNRRNNITQVIQPHNLSYSKLTSLQFAKREYIQKSNMKTGNLPSAPAASAFFAFAITELLNHLLTINA